MFSVGIKRGVKELFFTNQRFCDFHFHLLYFLSPNGNKWLYIKVFTYFQLLFFLGSIIIFVAFLYKCKVI